MDTINSPRSLTGRTGITIALSLATGLASLGTSIANTALPELATAFAAPLPQVQAVTVAYLASLTVCVVVAGRLADRFGAKAMLVLGLVLFALATGLCAAAPTLSVLIVARTFRRARYRGCDPPPCRNRKVQYEYDRAVYKQRNVIERMFCRLKDWRRLATRLIATSKTSWVPSLSPQPSSGGCRESRP
ncbi:hypothetical protein AKG11_30285 [Shinella sp. SUS2]|uniref:MFS transporter n=1 Tax=unclassified Shinella TaxID=2643062 RepID=UPI00068311E7|nr:hypothetical protein AKG11_30285 [Shinella sp. SUS2]KOC72078.1 hypothetical protein AKG10_29315 [Shinella sp. GWS1]